MLEAASFHRSRDDLSTLMDTLAHVYRSYKVNYTVVDSVTGLYGAREMMARTWGHPPSFPHRWLSSLWARHFGKDLEITELGLVKIGKPLAEMLKS